MPPMAARRGRLLADAPGPRRAWSPMPLVADCPALASRTGARLIGLRRGARTRLPRARRMLCPEVHEVPASAGCAWRLRCAGRVGRRSSAAPAGVHRSRWMAGVSHVFLAPPSGGHWCRRARISGAALTYFWRRPGEHHCRSGPLCAGPPVAVPVEIFTCSRRRRLWMKRSWVLHARGVRELQLEGQSCALPECTRLFSDASASGSSTGRSDRSTGLNSVGVEGASRGPLGTCAAGGGGGRGGCGDECR